MSAGNLVDPASSHMLVSKIKPCMCVYKFLHDATANGSTIQLLILYTFVSTWIPAVILELTHDAQSDVVEWLHLSVCRLQRVPLNE